MLAPGQHDEARSRSCESPIEAVGRVAQNWPLIPRISLDSRASRMPTWSRRIPFRVDVAGVIRIMGTSLYSRPDAAFRELLQNAHDAVMRRRRGDLAYKGRIDIVQDASARTISVSDDGIGLSPDEAETYLGTLGIGVTGLLKGQHPSSIGASSDGDSLIGQFGIGLFSAYMLADRLVVESRRTDFPEGVLWTAGEGTDIEVASSERTAPGTTVTLALKPEFAHLARAPEPVEAAVKEYADFLPVPIYLNGSSVRVNLIDASWFDATADPEAIEAEILTYFDESPLDVIPIRVEKPSPIAGALYVTPRRTPGFAGEAVVTTTIRRMVISRRTQGLLPEWASFLRGVLELAECSPTASREDLAKNAEFFQVRSTLEDFLYRHFEALAANDPPRMRAILAWHRYTWAGSALDNRRLRALLRGCYPFPTTRGPLTFNEVLAASPADLASSGEFDRVIWFNTDRRQERWVDGLFAEHDVPCVHALRGFEESLLAVMAADSTESGTATDLRVASPSSPGFGPTILGLDDLEDAAREWQEFLADCDAKVMVASFRDDQPVMAFLNEKHELKRALDDLGQQGSVPPSFQRLIDGHLGAGDAPRNEIVLNRSHELIATALSQKTSMPLAGVLRLLVHNALTAAGASVPRAAQRQQADDLAWIAECLRGRRT